MTNAPKVLITNAQRVRDHRQRVKDGSVVVQIVLTKTVVDLIDEFYIGVDGDTSSAVVQEWLKGWATDIALGDNSTDYGQKLAKRINSEAKHLNSDQDIKL